MALKVDEAAKFVFVQLIEQEPGIHVRCHADYAGQDKIDLVWERISHEMESGSRTCVEIVTEERMHPMFTFPNVVFKNPVALIYDLFHINFRLKCNLLSSHPFFKLHVSVIYGHHQVSSVLLNLLHCMSKFHIACESDIA
jgi:hypothetical protein